VPRVTRGTKRRQRRKKILARAKGFYQNKSKLYRYAKEAVDRSQKFAYVGRKLKKRDFRSLWIVRISAGARRSGLSYSRLMHGLKAAGVEINRKMLAEMAVRDPDAFRQVAAVAQTALGLPVPAPPSPQPAPEPKPAAKSVPKEKKPAATEPAAEAEPAAKAKAEAAGVEEKPTGDKAATKGKSGSASKPSDD
jgi:large subunit ribosomal protein L20